MFSFTSEWKINGHQPRIGFSLGRSLSMPVLPHSQENFWCSSALPFSNAMPSRLRNQSTSQGRPSLPPDVDMQREMQPEPPPFQLELKQLGVSPIFNLMFLLVTSLGRQRRRQGSLAVLGVLWGKVCATCHTCSGH